jgi:hypothetical protein
MHLYLIGLLAVSFYMFSSLKKPPVVPWRLGLRHFIVTAAVVVLTSEETHAVFYSVIHPKLAVAHYYVPKGFAPAWLYFCLSVAYIFLGSVIWGNSASLAARRPKARQVFLRIWPFYVILGLFHYVLAVQEHGVVTGIGSFFIYYILFTATCAFISFAFYLHYRSSSSDVLFFSQPAA